MNNNAWNRLLNDECKRIDEEKLKSFGFLLFPITKPDYYKPVLCLLENNMQVTAALDENNTDWVLYDGKLLDCNVVAWKELDDVITNM